MRTLLSVLLVVFWSKPAFPADSLRQEIRAHVLSRLSSHSAPGLAITVIHDGEVAWFEGLGVADKRKRTPITVDTVFSICSISKSVAAWGFMQLVERGELALDEPVLPRVKGWRPRNRREETDGITLRRLLSHTAGLSVHGVGGVPVGRREPSLISSLLGRAPDSRRLELIQTPGKEYRYSGGGFGLAMLLFEQHTGKKFAESLQENVVLPLQMTSSRFGWTPELVARSATPYMKTGRIPPRLQYPQTAAAGFVTSSRDFAKFAIACMPDHRSKKAEEVLSRKSLVQMIRSTPAYRYYGIGFALKPIRRLSTFGHTGGDYGWTSVLRIAPRNGDAIIIFQNCYEAEALSREVEDLWAKWVLEQGR